MTGPLTNGGLRHHLASQARDGIRHAENRIRACTQEIAQMQHLKAQLETALVALGITYEPEAVEPPAALEGEAA